MNPSYPRERVSVLGSIEEAIAEVDAGEGGQGKDVLVTGSLHLVGGVMEVAGLVEKGLRVD